ncbi:MAG: 2-C-methyl-D-erythritol 4-phosphate cytidylyltransferase [Elusimicrobiota bacterium]
MFVSTIIVAAGKGKRFGGKKQFYNLYGKPVILWSIEKFSTVSDELIVVLENADLDFFNKKILPRKLHRKTGNFCEIKTVSGGKERYDSVKNGLEALSPHSDIVCIHDGARPLIEKEDILRCINGAKKYGAAICAALASDTVKFSEKYFVKRTLDRNKLFLVQTPQAFKTEIILKAYQSISKKGLTASTDDSMVAEASGQKVRIVITSPYNIKITRKEDISIAEILLGSGIAVF